MAHTTVVVESRQYGYGCMAISESINCRIIHIFLAAEDGSRNKKTQTNMTTVTMSTSGTESAHVENIHPADGGCQTMEIENMRKENTII